MEMHVQDNEIVARIQNIDVAACFMAPCHAAPALLYLPRIVSTTAGAPAAWLALAHSKSRATISTSRTLLMVPTQCVVVSNPCFLATVWLALALLGFALSEEALACIRLVRLT
jgi:hypothetical protein